MAGFCWKPEYALGIPEMDRQHEEIFRQLGGVASAVAARADGGSIRELVGSLRRHAASHFGAEERLLEGVGFPDIVRQRVQHGQFLRRAAEAEAAAASGEGLSLEDVHGLQSWILGHVVGLDREYLPFVGGEAARNSQGKST